MNGPHDLGGQHGLGPIGREVGEPVFHAEWERRAFALTLAMGARGDWNLDMSRHARENRHPVDYLSSSYYELWLKGLEALMIEEGLVTEEEIAAACRGEKPPAHDMGGAVTPEKLIASLEKGDSTRLPDQVPARFQVGQRVRTRNLNPQGHTRLPRYARGRDGIVERNHGVFVFPDSNARREGTKPQHLYSVSFNARELWGEDHASRDHVMIDLFEDYLLPGEAAHG